ncbi:MAG TPA: hypothetical protein VHK23_05455 [Miltoncostaeaceae bacterium]|jgi:hypothetical protein|nr:hypothetical protein [Miltoncostaeaceae bacterium]
MKRLLTIGAVGGLLAWLGSIGALSPGLWKSVFDRERRRIPEQLKEALEAGKRAAKQAEDDLDREVRESFRVNSGPRPSP